MSGLTCIICSELYTNSDVIYSTTCGHIFHFSCMQQWRSRSSNCPQCREYNPATHRIFLDFEEIVQDPKLNEIKQQLDQTVKSRSELQLQLDEVEKDFLEIQKILVEAEYKISDLETANQYLKVQNDSREQEMGKIITNCNLNASEEAELLTVTISSLEDKMGQVFLELEQKNEECFKLSEENIKLEKVLERNDKMHSNTRNQYEAVERALKVQIEHLNQEIIARAELIENQKNALEEFAGAKNPSEVPKIHAKQENSVGEYQKQYSSTNDEIKSSELLIQKIKLERELGKSIDKIMELEEDHMRSKEILCFEIENLKADNERKEIEIKNRKEEHIKMINKFSLLGSKTTEITLRKRNEALSAKLEDTLCELERVLHGSAKKDTAIEKFKQIERLDRTKLDSILQEENIDGQAEHELKSFEKPERSDIKPTVPSTKMVNNTRANANEATSVVIRGIPESDIKTPLTDTVLLFTEIMGVSCKNSDIKDVFKMENKFKKRSSIQKENIALVVKFSCLHMKIKFLSNKEKLKTKGIQISEFMDNETNELFHHAKSLRSIGYKNIFCRNNIVFARFNFRSPALKISSKKEVNDIIKRANDRRQERSEKTVEECKEKYQNKLEKTNEEISVEECDAAYYRKNEK